MLTEKQHEEFKSIIALKQVELKKELTLATENFRKEVTSGEINPSGDHLADKCPSTERVTLATRIGNLQKQLRKCDEALENIETDTYGICLGCEEPIPLNRLRLVPFANMCQECKGAIEEQEKRTRTSSANLHPARVGFCY